MTKIILRGAINSNCDHEYIKMGQVYLHKEDTNRKIYDFDDIPVDMRNEFALYDYFVCNHCLLRRYVCLEW